MQITKLTICGGGNGAQTLLPIAASNLDCAVAIYAAWGDEAQRLASGIAAHGGLETTGAVQARARPQRVSADPAEVIPGSELVVLVLPAFAHEATLRQIAPFLEPGAWVGAIPARGGFDYCAAHVLAGLGRADVQLFGLQTLPWACRIEQYGQVVHVLGVKVEVDAATRPAAGIEVLAPLLAQMLGVGIGKMGNMLALTLANTGQIIHPGIMYALFADWDGASRPQAPLFYQGLTEEGAGTLAGLSDDVQVLCARLAPVLDVSAVRPLAGWLQRCYGDAITDPSSLWSAFVSNQAYAGLLAPMRQAAPGQFVPDFGARYLAEDVPFGLAVTRAIANLAEVKTPTIDRVVAWAGERLGKDYLGRDAALARIPQNYGLDSLERLVSFANEYHLNKGGEVGVCAGTAHIPTPDY
ncbi:MAG: NAD/NADP octopine/nopaline dehydrogenase family protein [Anaerolineae bacterium]|nr:NAD/NADP octopine/nopaline dehydrogenase family protein [Anaerolineae bacterium]